MTFEYSSSVGAPIYSPSILTDTASSRPSTKADSVGPFSSLNTPMTCSPQTSPEITATSTGEDNDVIPTSISPELPLASPTAVVATTTTSTMAPITPFPSATSSVLAPSTTSIISASTAALRYPSQSPHDLVRRISNRARKQLSRNSRNSSVPAASSRSRDPSARTRTRTTSPPPLPSPPHPTRNTEREANHPSDTEESLSDRDGSSTSNTSSTSINSIFSSSSSINSNSSNSSSSERGNIRSRSSSVYPDLGVQGRAVLKVSKKGMKKVNLMIDPSQAIISYTHINGKTRQIPIDNIKQVRSEGDTDQYRAELNDKTITAEGWFTLICSIPDKSKPKMIHLIADSRESRKTWTAALNSIMRERELTTLSFMSFDEDAVAKFWREAAAAKGESDPANFVLMYKTFEQLCQSMRFTASQKQLYRIFSTCATEDSKGLSYAQFCELLSMIREQSPINEVYRHVVGMRPRVDGKRDDGKTGLTRDEFFTFLQNVQCEDVAGNADHWDAIFRAYSTPDAATQSQRVTQVDMFNYLRSKHNPPLKKSQPQALTEPMNRYYISSSHNTYLLGRQIAGSSSVEGYISALIGGCRCVEIDCWDGPNGEPQVLHGRTLTSAVPFQSCITAINRWAFKASDYPLWISLEVHTDPAQQARMVEIMKTTFGSQLVTETLDSHPTALPSPEDLKGRILIKVKKPLPKDDTKQQQMQPQEPKTRRRGNSLTSSAPPRPPLCEVVSSPCHSSPPSPVLRPFVRARTLPLRSADMSLLSSAAAAAAAAHDSDSDAGTESTKAPVKVLGDLGVYCTGVKFRSFDAPEAKTFNHIFSFKEDSFDKHSRTKDLKNSLELHNRNYLMRVYPSQFRVTSKNFDPLVYWRRGVQMAALNWQTFDLGVQLNRAMFAGGNDSTGYVLKPALLRQHQVITSPAETSGRQHQHQHQQLLPPPRKKYQRKEISLRLAVVSAQQLICPSSVRAMHPYVEVEVFHASDACYKTNADNTVKEDMVARQKYRTRIIADNGYNPAFYATFNIDLTTRHEELVFLRFSVKLSTDGSSYPAKDPAPIGTYMVKLINLNSGYRFLPLWDSKGAQFLFSNLLCNVQLRYVRPVLVPGQEVAEPQSKLRSIGDKMFGRTGSANTSPRSTIEKE